MSLTYEELVDAAKARGWEPIHMGTPSCPYFGIDFGDRIVGVDTESVCVYEPEAFHRGTEETSNIAIPADADADAVMTMAFSAGN